MAKGPRDTATAKARNRRIREEARREEIAISGYEKQASDIIRDFMDDEVEMDPVMVQRKKYALDGCFKFMAKYIPDLKSTEVNLTDDEGKNPLTAIAEALRASVGNASN